MSNKYLFILILVCSILVSFTLIFSKVKNLENPQNQEEFKKEYEADSFDFPVGKPNGNGYYNAQKFGDNNHLGEDWNGVGGGNTDYGDSIYSIANGQVTFAKDMKSGWGKVIRIKHLYKGKYYESLYAHCSEIPVNKGEGIKRGTLIGKIGDCDGKYKAHLHFELRNSLDMPIGGGYSSDSKGYIDPTEFILKN
jgi:murein DD-endopeptidase MepM/ murein hydrolase activator NlpD